MSPLLAIVRTDLLRQLRQPITLGFTFLCPILLVVGGLWFTQGFVDDVEREVSGGPPATKSPISADATFTDWIEADDPLRLTEPARAVASVTVEDTTVRVAYRLDDATSRTAARRIRKVARRIRTQARDEALTKAGIDARFRDLLVVKSVAVTKEKPFKPSVTTLMTPLIITSILLTMLNVAMDVLTGEKERKTIEAVLVTPVSRTNVLLAKGLLTIGFGVIAGSIGVMATFGAGVVGVLDDPLSPTMAAAASAIVVGWALQIAPLLVALAALAPDHRTGSLMAAPVMLVAASPATVALFSDVELSPVTALVPVANFALLGRTWSMGQAVPGLALLVAGSTIVTVTGFTWLAARFVDRDATFLPRGSDRRTRSVVHAIVAFITVLGLFGFVGQPAQELDLLWGMVFTQIVVFAGTTVGTASLLGLDLRKTLSLRPPTLRDALLAGLIAPGVPAVGLLVARLQDPVLPMHTALLKALQQLEMADLPLWVPLLGFALLPGLAEELLFRGLLQGLLRQATVPTLIRITLVAMAFGIMHLYLPRILPTAALGLVLGGVVARSGSLWPAMALHAFNNGLALLAARQGGLPDVGFLGLTVITGGVVIGLFGMTGARRAD
ncbi:MAG: CPBP family glutamic-type intramembrane protease [Myxococcota bacterium]